MEGVFHGYSVYRFANSRFKTIRDSKIEEVTKALFFDLGNVLVPFDFQRAYDQLTPICRFPLDEIRQRLRSGGLVHRFETGQVTPQEFVAEFARTLQIDISYGEFCDLWSSIFLPATLIPEAWIERLARHYPLVLLSNTNAIHIDMIRSSYPLLGHFEHFVLSHEVGAKKPDARIYQEAIAKAGCAAGECFFADDLLVNVEGAREQGIDAVQFVSADQLAKDLRARGVTEF
jgi:putative hydrolase of the HAD superfamily